VYERLRWHHAPRRQDDRRYIVNHAHEDDRVVGQAAPIITPMAAPVAPHTLCRAPIIDDATPAIIGNGWNAIIVASGTRISTMDMYVQTTVHKTGTAQALEERLPIWL
jgi:hypothetical protein